MSYPTCPHCSVVMELESKSKSALSNDGGRSSRAAHQLGKTHPVAGLVAAAVVVVSKGVDAASREHHFKCPKCGATKSQAAIKTWF